MKKRPSLWLTLAVALVLVAGGLGSAHGQRSGAPDESASTIVDQVPESPALFWTGGGRLPESLAKPATP